MRVSTSNLAKVQKSLEGQTLSHLAAASAMKKKFFKSMEAAVNILKFMYSH
jgi:hypothetical protein